MQADTQKLHTETGCFKARWTMGKLLKKWEKKTARATITATMKPCCLCLHTQPKQTHTRTPPHAHTLITCAVYLPWCYWKQCGLWTFCGTWSSSATRWTLSVWVAHRKLSKEQAERFGNEILVLDLVQLWFTNKMLFVECSLPLWVYQYIAPYMYQWGNNRKGCSLTGDIR